MLKDNLEMAPFRHTSPGEGVKDYPGLSVEGVEAAKTKKAAEFLDFLEGAEKGTVLYVGAASENPRTISTIKAIGEGVKELIKEQDIQDIMVINWKDFEGIKEDSPEKVRMGKRIAEIVNENPDKKILVDLPLVALRYLSFGQWSGAYYDKLVEKTGSKDNYDNAKCWLETGGKPIDGIHGPDPVEVAKDQIRVVKVMEDIAKHYGVEKRPMVYAPADHSWHMAALAVYLANKGKIDKEGIQNIAKEPVREAEMMNIKIEGGQGTLIYNGKEYPIDPKLIEEVYSE
jgi:hypothetical protein